MYPTKHAGDPLWRRTSYVSSSTRWAQGRWPRGRVAGHTHACGAVPVWRAMARVSPPRSAGMSAVVATLAALAMSLHVGHAAFTCIITPAGGGGGFVLESCTTPTPGIDTKLNVGAWPACCNM